MAKEGATHAPKTEAEILEDKKMKEYGAYFKIFRAKEVVIKSEQGPVVKLSNVAVNVRSFPGTRTKTVTLAGAQLEDEEQRNLDSIKRGTP